MTLHWHTATHDYSAMLTPDLFGDWVLITTSGARGGGAGRVHSKQVASYGNGMQALQALRQRYRRQGRQLCAATFSEISRFDGPEAREAWASALRRVFENWALTVEEQAGLLGIGERALRRYLDGAPLENDASLLARAGHVLAINKALRLRLGRNAEAMRAWLNRPCQHLGQHSPLQVMHGSAAGLARLRAALEHAMDCSRGCVRLGAWLPDEKSEVSDPRA